MKRGETNDLIENTVIYWVLLLLFTATMITFIVRHQGGVDKWEEYYAFVIAETIDRAQPGDVISLDVSAPVQIGVRNKVVSASEMFVLNRGNHEVGVRLRSENTYWYSYVTNKTIANWHIDSSGDATLLVFEVHA